MTYTESRLYLALCKKNSLNNLQIFQDESQNSGNRLLRFGKGPCCYSNYADDGYRCKAHKKHYLNVYETLKIETESIF